MASENEVAEGAEEAAVHGADEAAGTEAKSFFARGAFLGLVGGAVVALMVISGVGSAVSLVDDIFGSSTAAVADDAPVDVDPAVAAGETVATNNGCTACHSTDGSVVVGPSWQGLSERVDEDGIRTSILDPNAVITDGFTADVMPVTYADDLSAEDLDALVAYLASL